MSRRAWLCLGIGTEAFHVLFIVGILVLGKMWLPANLVNLAIPITVMGQIILLWCPLSVFSSYCYRKHNPKMKLKASLTLYLYGMFGRKVGIPIFVVLIVVSTLVGMARF